MRSSRVWMRSSLSGYSVWLSVPKIAIVLGSIPASSDTVDSDGRLMNQCWITYIKKKKPGSGSWFTWNAGSGSGFNESGSTTMPLAVSVFYYTILNIYWVCFGVCHGMSLRTWLTWNHWTISANHNKYIGTCTTGILLCTVNSNQQSTLLCKCN